MNDHHEHTSWGEIDLDTAEAIKRSTRKAVGEGVTDALESGCVEEGIARGLQAGIRRAAEDEELCDLLMSRLAESFRRRAAKASGEIVVDGLIGLARKAAWLALTVGLLYAFGGVPALVAAWKYMTAKAP